MLKTDVHADDFALTVNTSRDILECVKAGKVSSISVIPNTSCFDECMQMLIDAMPSLPYLPLMSVHINLVEGLGLAAEPSVPLCGLYKKSPDSPQILIKASWMNLLWWSVFPKRKTAARQAVKNEVFAQIDKCRIAIDKCIDVAKAHNIPCCQTGLRLDSHQHTHVLDAVWSAMMEYIAERGADVEYIRNPLEPIRVFLDNGSFGIYKPVNILKNRILSAGAGKINRFYKEHNIPQMYMWGVILSGDMNFSSVRRLLPFVKEDCEEHNRTLEIVFHPGSMLKTEITSEYNPAFVRCFYLSKRRKKERYCIRKLDSQNS